MNTARLSLLLAGTLAAGLAIGAGGVTLLGPIAPAQAPAVSLVPPPEAVPPQTVPAAPAVPQPRPAPGQGQGAGTGSWDDAARAREGVRQGVFVPLATIFETVRARFPGEVLGATLSEDDGVTSYEVKVLTAKGLLLEVEVDPKTGRIVRVEEEDD